MDELKLSISKADVVFFEQKVKEVLFENIIPFWLKYSKDEEHGGFWGRIDNTGRPLPDAPKSLILNARILWTFSVLYRKQKSEIFLTFAERAWHYLQHFFWDQKFGGMFWLLDAHGKVQDDHKKMYGQAFAIYALSEYFRITQEEAALKMAIDIFELMLKHNWDHEHGGFLESASRNWQLTQDMRLSDKDMNTEKSMNTHLHLMEAFTAFYSVWPDSILKNQLKHLVEYFLQFIFNRHNHHLNLYFNRQWQVQSRAVSFGHDIEASWLLLEALNVLNEPSLFDRGKTVALQLARSTLQEGLQDNFAIYKERCDNGHCVKRLEWWQQAEAVVGFLQAFLLTHQKEFWQAAKGTWQFLVTHLVDWENGEWFYELDEQMRPNLKTFKISEWKGPYHNTRACLELLGSLQKMKGSGA